MPQPYQRRIKNFFIKRNLQGKVILAVFLAAVIGCLVFIVIFGVFSADTMTISYSNNDLQMGRTPVMLFKNAIAANWVFLVICGTLLVIASLIGTHRIAGPLYRFEKTLDNMNVRNLSDTIRLRGKDEGKDLALKINRFNAMLSRDVRELNRRSKAITDLVNHFDSLKHANLTPEEIDSLCQAIRNNNSKIKILLDDYQPADD